jgi:hypothetical protein
VVKGWVLKDLLAWVEYGLNNPIDLVDPSGKAITSGPNAIAGILGGIAGGASSISEQLSTEDNRENGFRVREVLASVLNGALTGAVGRRRNR